MPRSARFAQLLVVLATLVAALVRIPAIGTLPPQVWFDEIWFAQTAREWLRGAPLQVYYETYWGGVHPLLVILTGLVQTMGFESPIASRLISVPSGIAAIPLAYAALTTMLKGGAFGAWRYWVGALAAWILALLPTWVVVARIGIEWPVAAAFTALIIWSYERARRTAGWARWGHWALCGLVLGGGQYLSQHMRFVALLLVAFVIHDLLTERNRGMFRGAVFSAGCAFLTVLPLLARFYEEPALLTARAAIITNTHGLSRFEFLRWNLWLVTKGFFVAGSSSPLENVAGRPLFNVPEAVAFAVGLLTVLARLRRAPAGRKMLLWLGILSLPTLLTEGAPSFERMTHAIPAAAGVAAIGALTVVTALDRVFRIGRINYRARLLVAAATLGAHALHNVAVYYVQYPRMRTLDAAFTAPITQLARRAVARAEYAHVNVERITESENMVHFDFLLDNTQVRYLDFRQCLPLVEDAPDDALYIVNSQRDPISVGALKLRYPGAAISVQQSESAWLIDALTLVTVPARSRVELAAGAPITFEIAGLRAYDISAAKVRAGDSLFLTLYWRAHAVTRDDFTAFVHVAADAISPPVAQRDGAPCQGLHPTSRWRLHDVTPDAFAITIPPDTPPGEYGLYAGWYHVKSLERSRLITAPAGIDAGDNRARIATIIVTAR